MRLMNKDMGGAGAWWVVGLAWAVHGVVAVPRTFLPLQPL
jgi:hypothetical protein